MIGCLYEPLHSSYLVGRTNKLNRKKLIVECEDKYSNLLGQICSFAVQRFLCGGRLVFGPDAASLFLTSLLIGCPAITFCIKMLLLIRAVEPSFGYPVLIAGVGLTLMVGSCNGVCMR